MPKRTEEIVNMQEYSYEDLLLRIRTHIDGEYGGVSNFLKHEMYEKCGFEVGAKETAKMFTYLALPKETNDGTGRRIKSFPVLKKLYKGLLGVDIQNDIQVQRTQVIKADLNQLNLLDTPKQQEKEVPKDELAQEARVVRKSQVQNTGVEID